MTTGMTGSTNYGIASLDYGNAAIRLADEGVPIAAINRALKLPEAGIDLRAILNIAVHAGRLLGMPREDWPPLQGRDARVPSTPPHKPQVLDDDDMIINVSRTFRTTRLQSRVLLRLLRRDQCTKSLLHDAVEENRGNPADPTEKKIVDVVICHLRKKLTPFGLRVVTIHSSGYTMPPEDRARGLAMIEKITTGGK